MLNGPQKGSISVPIHLLLIFYMLDYNWVWHSYLCNFIVAQRSFKQASLANISTASLSRIPR